MKWMIFEHGWQGHRLEYIHHQYIYAGEKLRHDNIIIVANPKLRDRISLLNWPVFSNIEIIYFDNKYAEQISSSSKFIKSWILSKILHKYYKIYKPDKIILNVIISFIPFLPVFIGRMNVVRGIIYLVPYYRENPTLLKKFIDKFIYKIFAKSKSIDRIWLLNASSSVDMYNEKYKVKKFAFLPDPINISEPLYAKKPSFAYELVGKHVFLHAGGMGLRKGTDKIIEAIRLMSPEELGNNAFIFAGSYADTAQRKKMLQFIDDYKNKAQLYFLDSFLPFEDLVGYFQVADFILLPYVSISQSSGILGYSAYFHKPVIGPQEGLLGELISKYKLGITISNITPEKLKNNIINLSNQNIDKYGQFEFDNYVKLCRIDSFSQIIFANE